MSKLAAIEDDDDSPALDHIVLARVCARHLADLRRHHPGGWTSLHIAGDRGRTFERPATFIPRDTNIGDVRQDRVETRVRSRQQPSAPKPFKAELFL